MRTDRLIVVGRGSDARSAWTDIAIIGTQLTVTQEVAEQLLQHHPSLACHACKSSITPPHQPLDSGFPQVDPATFGLQPNAQENRGVFGKHLPGALLPHALEHLAIDLLVETFPGETFAGNTCWLEREEQTMRVRISLPKEGSPTPVFQAFSGALVLLNGFLSNDSRQIG